MAPIFETYSKRQKRLRGDAPDVYTYDEIPYGLKVQIIHLWDDAIGLPDKVGINAGNIYTQISNVLSREYGRFTLFDDPRGRHLSPEREV